MKRARVFATLILALMLWIPGVASAAFGGEDYGSCGYGKDCSTAPSTSASTDNNGTNVISPERATSATSNGESQVANQNKRSTSTTPSTSEKTRHSDGSGLGKVMVMIGLPILAALVLFIWAIRRRKKHQETPPPEGPTYWSGS